MDSLLQDIIDRIGHFVDLAPYSTPISKCADQYDKKIKGYVVQEPLGPQLSALATLSRSWQRAVGTRTFKKLHIKSTEIDALQSIVVGHRRILLRELGNQVKIRHVKLWARFPDNKTYIDGVFTRALHRLFFILKSWENDGVQTSLHLVITGDNTDIPADKTTIKKSLKWKPDTEELADLGTIEDLPSLDRISRCTMSNYPQYTPSDIVGTAQRFPNLTQLHLIPMGYACHRQSTRPIRIEFSEALDTFSSLTLTELYMDQTHDSR
jgi:hypothetical protein